MKLNGIEIDPASNPAVLDTYTWDRDTAAASCRKDEGQLVALAEALAGAVCEGCVRAAIGKAQPLGAIRVSEASAGADERSFYALATLDGGQKVILRAGRDGKPWDIGSRLGRGIVAERPDNPQETPGPEQARALWSAADGRPGGSGGSRASGGDRAVPLLEVFPLNYVTLPELLRPSSRSESYRGPRALGTRPRLGVGSRQSVTVWPGVFSAIEALGLPCEVIQNSAYRELAPMDVVLSPPRQVTTLPGHGSVGVGHTGSSIQGLWLYGVVCALESGLSLAYGADCDHIPVRAADAESLKRAKGLIWCGRNYSFFTLDTSFMFNSGALGLEGAELDEAFARAVPGAAERRGLLERHRGLSDVEAKRLAAAYLPSVQAAGELYAYIRELKGDEEFDFEFSLDEGPGATSPGEQAFVLSELVERGGRAQFVAPNVGFEKRVDYRMPDGLAGLEARVADLARVAADFGCLLDFHSGSDKSADTYRAIAKATRARLKLKVAGKLQLILAEVMEDVDPAFFREWWAWTLESAEVDARAGNRVAKDYVDLVLARREREGKAFKPSARDRFFTDFAFGMVGAKDAQGRFIHRERFYRLPGSVRSEYSRRVKEYVVGLAGDLGLAGQATPQAARAAQAQGAAARGLKKA